MKFAIVTAALLGAFLAPVLANRSSNVKGLHREGSHHPDTGGSTDSTDGSAVLESVWDIKTGFVATKVHSKHTCIISKLDRSFPLEEPFPVPPQGLQGPRPHQLPPRENRFIISTWRLHSLHPYGKQIQLLCSGTPAYFAFPAPGSNFLEKEFSCLKVEINERPIYYCD